MTDQTEKPAAADDLELRIAKLVLGPGDILVLKSARKLPIDRAEAIKRHLKVVVPDNKVMIVDPDFEISVLQKPAAAAGTAPAATTAKPRVT